MLFRQGQSACAAGYHEQPARDFEIWFLNFLKTALPAACLEGSGGRVNLSIR